MVYKGASHKNGGFRGTPILENPDIGLDKSPHVSFPARQLVEVVDIVVLNTNKGHTSLVLLSFVPDTPPAGVCK